MKATIIHIEIQQIFTASITKDPDKRKIENEKIFNVLVKKGTDVSNNIIKGSIIDTINRKTNSYSPNTASSHNTDCEVIFMLVPIEALSNWYFFIALANSKFRKFDNTSTYGPVPIVFINVLNILPNYSIKDSVKIKQEHKSRTKCFTIDKRIEFLDSSIWHYYLPVEEWNGKSFDKNLEETLLSIKGNCALRLYETNVAREFLEFQVRMMKQSYLANVGGGHADYITPVVFHSETMMKYEAQNIIRSVSEYLKKIKWNVLLIDDYAQQRLKIGSVPNGNTKEDIFMEILKDFINENFVNNITLTTVGKDEVLNTSFLFIQSVPMHTRDLLIKKIKSILTLSEDDTIKKIKDTLKQILNDYVSNDFGGRDDSEKKKISELNKLFFEDFKSIFKCSGIIGNIIQNNKALVKLIINKIEIIFNEEAPSQYDIILLDYLLGEKSTNNNEREYGDEFLHELERNEELLKRKGPLGKFWIFPISSFSNAMLSKLKEEGIGRINNNWYIMDGADMINTPNLFIYNFLKLIELQLQTAIVTKEDVIYFIINNLANDYSGISDKKCKDKKKSPLRQNARRLYGIFMHKFGLRDALKYDVEQGSAFAQSVLQYMYNERLDDLQFYERVRKLLYLVGFGTHNDAALMWDLLTSINTVVDSLKGDFIEKERVKINSFLKYIADYISELTKHNG